MKFGFMKWLLMGFAVVMLSGCGGGSSSGGSHPQDTAIAQIKAYAQNGGEAPSADVYKAAGVTGVDAGNINEINAVVAGLTEADVDTPAKIQSLVNGLGGGVAIPDVTVPVITIMGDNPVSIMQGVTYSDAGATASDDRDGSRPVTIVRNTVDTSAAGDYEIVYHASDTSGNEANATRVVKVIAPANTPPVAQATATPTVTTQGEVITFDGSGSTDSDGTIVKYEWKEGTSVLHVGVSFTEDTLSVGTHNVVLTVTDDGNATDSTAVSVTVQSASSLSTQIKKTGQTKSYDADGNEVTDGSIKDDGYYQKGAAPSYTRDDATNIVTDHITGLQWQDDAAVKTVTKQWVTQANYDAGNYSDTSGDTATTYCATLTLGTYTDWRLPTIDELMYIVDRSKGNPAIDTSYFNNIASLVSDAYWSSTSVLGDPYDAFNISFKHGRDYWSNEKKHSHHVRCVRDE